MCESGNQLQRIFQVPSFLFSGGLSFIYLFYFLSIYLFIHERHTQREAETQAEGEAGSMQGLQGGTRSQDSRIMPWAEVGANLLSHPGCPYSPIFWGKNKPHMPRSDIFQEKKSESPIQDPKWHKHLENALLTPTTHICELSTTHCKGNFF